jgi:PAS domain S-box-containing protein
LLGYEEHEIGNGMNEWDQRVHPDDKQLALASLQENLDGITDSFTNEHRVRCKDGHYIWLLDRGKVVQRDASGKALRVIGTHTDITQRKNLERIKSEFVSTVSHELRTPLTSIRGSLGLLEGGVLGVIPPKALALISVASKNCQRLITLVNDILDMDKLLSGKMNLDIINTDLNELILQSIEANAGYGSSYQVQFDFENSTAAARTPQFGQVDVNRFMQIMANLLSNAAKFSKPQSQVNIRLQANEHFLRIEVEDHGEGIPLDFQSRIFEAFAQADSANTRKQGSTGLGLNISKNLVEKMGGEIGFQTKLGVGTTFWFTVPVA